MTHTHHAIDYIELQAADLPTAQSFYEQAFGWSFTSYGPTYAGIQGSGGGEAGGIAQSDSVQPPLVILFSNDLDASVAAVEAAGGTITVPPYEFPAAAHFTSPTPRATRWPSGPSGD